MEEQNKAKRKYKNKYKKIYAILLEDNKTKVEEIIDTMADIAVCMDDCMEHIKTEGLVVEMQQGNYSIERENPYSKIYNDKNKLLNMWVKLLDDMMPNGKESAALKAGEALAGFIAKGKPKGAGAR